MPRSARARKALAVVAIVAVTALVVGLVQLRRTTLEAQALERAEAREGLAQEVTALTASLTEPLREIDAASEPTLTVLAETLAGTNGDAEELLDDLDAAVTRMLVAAGELDQASERPVPERPRVLQVEEVEPILDRLVVLN